MKKAIYVGSFDPLHEGHISIINKSLKITDELVVVVANNPEKNNNEINMRFQKLKEKMSDKKNIIIKKMEKGLIADLAKKLNINCLIRSARNNKDFNFELMMSLQNKKINKNLETILIMPDKANIKIRSSLMPKDKSLL